MKFLLKLAFIGIVLSMSGYSQTELADNVQFKDMDGKSYDLYNLIDNDQYVFLELMMVG